MADLGSNHLLFTRYTKEFRRLDVGIAASMGPPLKRDTFSLPSLKYVRVTTNGDRTPENIVSLLSPNIICLEIDVENDCSPWLLEQIKVS